MQVVPAPSGKQFDLDNVSGNTQMKPLVSKMTKLITLTSAHQGTLLQTYIISMRKLITKWFAGMFSTFTTVLVLWKCIYRQVKELDSTAWPSNIKYEYLEKTSTSLLWPHIERHHLELYQKLAQERSWRILLPGFVSQVRSQAESASSPTPGDHPNRFDEPTFHQTLLNFMTRYILSVSWSSFWAHCYLLLLVHFIVYKGRALLSTLQLTHGSGDGASKATINTDTTFYKANTFSNIPLLSREQMCQCIPHHFWYTLLKTWVEKLLVRNNWMVGCNKTSHTWSERCIDWCLDGTRCVRE